VWGNGGGGPACNQCLPGYGASVDLGQEICLTLVRFEQESEL